ncbi:MAG: hypothetical protein ABIX28_20765 [Vicinamibacterales bacterium]
MTRRALLAAAAAVVVLAHAQLHGHRLDEYLQATRLSVAVDRIEIEIDLTPGVAIAERIVGAIDADRNGRFSPAESAAYAQTVLAALSLTADRRALPLTPGAQLFPGRQAMLEGLGTIRLRAAAPLPRTSGGRHTLEYRNGYRPEASVYLANTLVPDDQRITIEAQDRDPLQQRLTVTYDVPSSRTRRAGGIAASLTVIMIVIARRRRASAGRA